MPAVFVSDSALLRRGFDLKMGWLSVGWAVALFGIGAIALLLWGGSGTQAAWIPRVQLGLGAAIVLIALLHAAPQPGVAVAAVGGGALAGGAILTLRRGAEQ